MSRFRRFALTWNNYGIESLDTIVSTGHSYIVVGKEVGDSGTPHYQIYVEYEDAKTFSSVIKAFLKKAHCEVARASAEKNRDYCLKQEVILEEGKPKRQGSRNDLKIIKDNIKLGKGITGMLESEEITSYQGLRCAELLMKYVEPERVSRPKVFWRWGGAGVGKSKWAYQNYTNVFTPISFKWWEGYDGHKVVLIDDLRRDFCRYNEFLKLIDRYPYRVENKGGSRQLLAEIIIITSPYHPADVWNVLEESAQLERRLDSIEEIKI